HLLQTKPTPHNHLIFYLHGGGYILGPGTPQWSLSQYLARHTQHDLALLDYPKAPENNAATTIDITNQAFDHLLKQYPANHITIIGDSAGGGLALALAHYRRDHNLSLPRQLILLSPWLDLTLAHPAIPQYQNDVILDQQGLILCGLSYAADQDPQHPYLSPINAPPHQNLPTHIFASTAEILYPDCHDYAQLAQQQNAPTHLHTYHQTPHVWPLIPMPETTHARQKMRTLLTP
ncbi:MAG TPA: alpha/beta hydrolase, partial [Anaerolineae bacterium]|nr:alpha/beta hydrolase [Anaerolineae bacterium]